MITFDQVLSWCRANKADVRGVYRGRDISISHMDQGLPDLRPNIGEIFHWDVKANDFQHPVSASDLERMIAGRLTIEQFRGTLRGRD